MSDSTSVFVGVDVSKDWIDLCWLEGDRQKSQRISRQNVPLQRMAKKLKEQQVRQVVLEASGGYEQAVIEKLQSAGVPVSLVNPKRVRDFAKAAGLLAKTDRVDAYALALFARQMRPRLSPPVDPARRQLRQLVRRRQQLVRMRASERVRLRRQSADALDSASYQRLIEFLSEQIESIEAMTRELVDSSTAWTALQRLLQSVPGVGSQTAWTLLAQLPELGSLDAKSIASLAGLAPFARDSGQHRGRRQIAGGRKLVRQMLYMAARTAACRDSHRRTFYQDLRDRSKPAQVALIAVARKLLVVLNAIVRDQRPWDPAFPTAVS
jgi:transposase